MICIKWYKVYYPRSFLPPPPFWYRKWYILITVEVSISKPYLFFVLCHCASNGIKVMPPLRHPKFQELEIIKYCIFFICSDGLVWEIPSPMVTLPCLGDFIIARLCTSIHFVFILKIKQQFPKSLCSSKEKWQWRNEFATVKW